MIQVLFPIPAVLVLLFSGAILGFGLVPWLFAHRYTAMLFPGLQKIRWAGRLGLAFGIVVALLIGWQFGWLGEWLPVRGYGTMILAGFLTGVWLARRRAPQLGVDPDACLDVGLLGALGGVTGARLLHVVLYWKQGYAEDLWRIFAIWEGGLVFYGAFITAIPIAALYCRARKIPIVPFLDMAAPCLIAGLALGRLGCFMRGCCFGKVCNLPVAVRFPEESDAAYHYLALKQFNGLTPPLHPTQLYAAVGAGLVAAFLYVYWPRRRFDGQVLGMMIVMAGVTRFFEELLRADVGAALPQLSAWMTTAQWTAIGLVLFGAAWLIVFARKNERYLPPAAQPA